MRRFWIPVIPLHELPPSGGDPMEFELLGERFVLWRDETGRPGLFDDACAHRGCSMLISRAEGDGLRCIYHGWKFAVDGTVLDTPNVADPKYKHRIKGRVRPVREAGGLLWAYLGPAAQIPPFPHWQFMDVSDRHRIAELTTADCNYVQIMEGFVDSSHLSVLHSSQLEGAEKVELQFAQQTAHLPFDAAPQMEADETDFGFHYVAIRQIGDKQIARVTAFVAPFAAVNPNGDIWLAAVPMNDERCYFFHVIWDADKPVGEEPLLSQRLKFTGLDRPTLERFGLTFGTCNGSLRMTSENRYLQDRTKVRAGHFTGYPSFNQEDTACSVSSGALRDRSFELLCPSDVGVSRLYRALLACAKAARDGDPIPGAGLDISHVRGVSAEITKDADWRQLVPQHRVVVR
ncbi:Rieske 2Fe-2S domain-containing protein [Mycolicibacterium novocastrense]|uniref:Rieske 2Fe-2S domain-containing protein n=1 Tax=Mycolicibacterium novocastrense TaxID=59813 RepID=UPI002286F4CC|nr:Rieske 2Fe-2S domain-containing protein [Mycolicibacterium novocastrense]